MACAVCDPDKVEPPGLGVVGLGAGLGWGSGEGRDQGRDVLRAQVTQDLDLLDLDLDGLATSDTAVLVALLNGLGLQAAAQALQIGDAGLLTHARERMQKARSAWQQLGLQGVPALQVQAAGGSRVVTGQVLYGAPQALLSLVRGH